MKFRPAYWTSAVVAAAFAVFANNAYSQTQVSLESLLSPGTTFTSGDLLFSDFTASQVGNVSVDLNSVFVVQETGGILFQSGNWSFGGAGVSYDLALGFDVTTIDGTVLNGLSSTITGNAGGDTTGGHSVLTETAQTASAATLGTMSVYVNYPVTGITLLNNSMTFDPQPVLVINKDFSMTTDAGDAAAQISVSHFDQTFTTVPEPSSLAFGIIGGLGMLLVFRRK